MRSVKNRSHAVERNPDPRTTPLRDLGIHSHQKGLNVGPLDRRWNRILENLGQSFPMSVVQLRYDTT